MSKATVMSQRDLAIIAAIQEAQEKGHNIIITTPRRVGLQRLTHIALHTKDAVVVSEDQQTVRPHIIEAYSNNGLHASWAEVAVKMMRAILYDNGMVNWREKEYIDPKWVNKIADAAFAFHDAADDWYLNDDENIDEICCGEYSEVMAKYGNNPMFGQLYEVLNEFHDTYTGKPEGK